jgi:hypothetical protein
MSGLGLALAGAAQGLGDGIVQRAEDARQEALMRLERDWQRQDRQEDRAWRQEDRNQDREWDVSDRNQDRNWSLEDERRGNEREDSIVNRSAGALRAVTGGDGSLFDLIDATEGGGGYDTLFGYSQKDGGPFSGVSVSNMTLDELAEFSSPQGEYGQWVKANSDGGVVATPMGRHQIVGTTLRAAAEEMGLPGDTVFTPDVQDQIAMHLAKNRLEGQTTMSGKRAALRNEWEGFRKVSDADLDRAITMFESGDDIYRTAVDPNVPSDVRDTVTGQSGLGVRAPTASERAASGGSSASKPVNLSASLDTRLRRRFVDPSGYDDEPDYETIDVLKEEITRLMEEDGLSESQAEQRAISAMVFEEGTKTERQGGFLGIGGDQVTVPDGNRTFTGSFNYGDEEAPAANNTGLGARPPAAPTIPETAPKPTTPPANDYSPDQVTDIVEQARQAIAAGADRAAVIARLTEMGIDPEGI